MALCCRDPSKRKTQNLRLRHDVSASQCKIAFRCGWAVAAAVIRWAQMRAVFYDLAGDFYFRQPGGHGGRNICDRGRAMTEKRRRRSHVFTPTAIQLVRRLADQGKSASEIAEAIGSTAASVRARCCQLKIKLTWGAPAGSPEKQQRHIQKQKLIIGLNPAVYAGLERQAAQMQKSPVELAGMLLEAIVSSEIYEAVLDEGE